MSNYSILEDREPLDPRSASPTAPVLTTKPSEKNKISTKLIAAWAAWDWASAAFNAVITTFVFTVYLTNKDLFGPDADKILGWGLAVAGILIAIFAPASGQNADRSGRRIFWLRIYTILVGITSALLFFVVPMDPQTHDNTGLYLGVFLLAIGNIFFELASVNYNAMLNDISTPKTVGRISGIAWAAGYIGGIVLLLILFQSFIKPYWAPFGLAEQPGGPVRFTMLIAAIWLLAFSAPLLLMAKDNIEIRGKHKRLGLVDTYRHIWKQVTTLYKHDRRTLHFLVASAIFRDGLAGVFTFGGIIAGTVYGFSPSDVILFAIAANVVAGIFTILAGFLEDKVGSKNIIVFSLGIMTIMGVLVFALHPYDYVAPASDPTATDSYGRMIFWIFGIMLCVFVGPIQSASRTYLSRITPAEYEGQVFGLYATTGRAVSFLAPFMYSTAVSIGSIFSDGEKVTTSYFGILGIVIVLIVGLVLTVTLSGDTTKQMAVASID